MKNRFKTIPTLIAALALAACGNDRTEQPAQAGEIPLRIAPTVIQSPEGMIEAMTRGKVEGEFQIGATIGLGISAPAAVPALPSFYDDFYARFNGDAWRYYLNDINNGDRLSGFANWHDIEVYGYYPYDPATTDLAAVPFRIADMDGAEAKGTDATALTDYMVAGTQCKDMFTPNPVGDLPLQFGHMMTAIELVVNRALPEQSGMVHLPVMKLGRATFEITEGPRKFVVSGTYNAINPDTTNIAGNITPGQAVTKMTIDYLSSTNITFIRNPSVTPVPHRLLVIMPELRQNASAGFEDATVKITFDFIDQDGQIVEFDDGKPTVSFRLSDVANAGKDNGLLAGYSYAVTASIGYYTHFVAPTGGSPTPPHVNRPDLEDDGTPNIIEL